MSDSGFFSRQHGHGPYWDAIERLFEVAKRKAGFEEFDHEHVPMTFRRPGREQARLF